MVRVRGAMGPNRAAASGRLRADRSGAFPDQYLKQYDNFIIQFISININDFVTIRHNLLDYDLLRSVTIRYDSLHIGPGTRPAGPPAAARSRLLGLPPHAADTHR